MIAKTITYTDYNGTPRTETFYFNMTKAELTMFRLSYAGGMDARLQQIIDSKSEPEIAAVFEDILRRSYGVKDLDGRRFRKSDELFEEFKQTEAYSELIMELLTDTDAAIAFVNGVMPAGSAQVSVDATGKVVAMPTNN